LTLWAVAIALLFCLKGAARLQADPTDDLSISLSHPSAESAYRLMPEKRVTMILEDHLDGFPESEAPLLARHLLELCRRYRFDPAFILSLIQVESGFRIDVESPFGAIGLMQIMPATALKMASDLGVKARSLTDPYYNLMIGVSYLAYLRDYYRGLPPYYLVAAYNIGPSKMDELRSRKSFKPVNTKKYYEAIRRGVPDFRYYRRQG
jgi:soluble lytic murein transglycosylase-like protein